MLSSKIKHKSFRRLVLAGIFPVAAACLFLVLLSGCSSNGSGSSSPRLTPDSQQAEPGYLKRVKINFSKGEELLMKGDVQGARFYFDRVIDLFLDSVGGASGERLDSRKKSRLNAQLYQYIERIAAIERSYLKDKTNGEDKQEEHEAFLDEVITTPLFKPAQHEVSRLKQQMDDKEPEYSIPVTINPRVVSFIKAFSKIRHKNIQRALNRSVDYIDEFKKIFKAEGVPTDLAYLPIIESGFRVNAVSRARARGAWQFMASTARMFGLRVDWVVDERRDPFKACAAAARYLKTLYKEYGDWYLALACYNGGPRRVNRAIRRLRTKDFFKIARSRYIKRETRNYVPAFLASLIIAKDPETYGFKIDKSQSEKIFHKTKTITVPSPVSVAQIAKLAKIPVRTLRKINPELLREFTPFNKKQYTLRVPENIDASIMAQLKRLPPAKRYYVGWYRVRRGDSLYSIARKFNTSVRRLKSTNKLRSNLIKPGKRLLIPRGG